MKNQKMLEHLKGKYGIIIAVITAIGTLAATVFTKGDGAKNQQELNIKTNQNSPVATEIHTQNNYYGTPPLTNTATKQDTKKDTIHPTSRTKKVEPIPEKTSISTGKEPATIDASNALIVTQNQSGGTNTVNVNKIEVPPPSVKLASIEVHNLEVKELPLDRHQREERRGPNGEPGPSYISLPSEEYNYEKLYKTRFSISYTCPVTLSKVGFWIKRERILYVTMSHIVE